MFVSPVGFNNPYAFRAKYTNPDGRTVDVSQETINRVESTAYIRTTVDKAMQKVPKNVLRKAENGVNGNKKLYFAINEEGKCVISNKKVPMILYSGEINSSPVSIMKKQAGQIKTIKYFPEYRASYVDNYGILKTEGTWGDEYARILPNGKVDITAPELVS